MKKARTLVLAGLLFFSALIAVTPIQAAEEGTPAWFYANLTAADRLNIRIAMDKTVPRAAIIDGILQGWGEMQMSPLSSAYYGFTEDFDARTYDPVGALDLLEGVFDYRYDEAGTNGSEKFYFKMTSVCPTTNTARTQWASLIARAWTDIGIDVSVKWLNWNILLPRIYDSPIGHGFDWENGGYDVYFAGWSANSPDPDWESMYGSTYYPPNGQNTGWVENDASDEIWSNALTSLDQTVRDQALYDFQEWYYDTVPKMIMPKSVDIYGVRNEWSGFDTFNKGYYLQNMTSDLGTTELVYIIPGDFKDFNPIYSNSYYDFVAIGNVHPTVGWRPSADNLVYTPQIYSNWTISADGLTYTATMKEGIKFSDGTPLTVDDIIFSYHSQFDEDLGAPQVSGFLDYFNNTGNIKKIDAKTVELTLVKYYPYVGGIIDTYVLKKAQMDLIDVADWKTDDSNTKTTPIGLGPYMFDPSFTATSAEVQLIPNPYYNGTLMGHDPTNGIWLPQPSVTSITIKVVKDSTSAVTGLKTGIYDILDANVGIQAQAAAINASTYGYLITALAYDWQEATFNQYSPIWGMNPGDPSQMYPSVAPWDPIGIFFAIVGLAGINLILRRRRK